jgi:hypothetical protein
MYGTTIFVRTPTLKLTIGQRNGLKSFMKKTNDKKEYRRAQAVLEKSEDFGRHVYSKGIELVMHRMPIRKKV